MISYKKYISFPYWGVRLEFKGLVSVSHFLSVPGYLMELQPVFQICGSVSWTSGSGSCYFFLSFFVYYFLKFFKYKKSQRSNKTVEILFSLLFLLDDRRIRIREARKKWTKLPYRPAARLIKVLKYFISVFLVLKKVHFYRAGRCIWRAECFFCSLEMFIGGFRRNLPVLQFWWIICFVKC